MDMKKMMKQAQKMQAEAARAQEEITNMEFEASAGGGMVKVKALGDMTLESITINPEAVDPDDVEMLQDLIITCVNEAMGKVDSAQASELGKFNIPGIM